MTDFSTAGKGSKKVMAAVAVMAIAMFVLICSSASGSDATNTYKDSKGIHYSYDPSGNEATLTKWDYPSGYITIPDTVYIDGKTYKVTEIGENAISGTNNVMGVVMGINVNKIGKSAFERCAEMVSADLKNVTEIEESAFYRCFRLSMYLPTTVEKIGPKAFTFVSLAFYNSSLYTNVCVDNAILYTIENGEAVVKYGNGNSASIPNTIPFKSNTYKVTKIDADAFKAKVNVKTVTIGNNVVSIGDEAFSGKRQDGNTYSKLETLNLGTSLVSMGAGVFAQSASLTTINLNGNTNFALDSSNKMLYQLTDGNAVLKAVTNNVSDEAIPDKISIDGSDRDITGIDAGAFQKTAVENIIIGNNVKYLGDGAFQGCTELKTVTFGASSSLEKIGTSAFAGCKSLTAFAIPKSVTSLNTLAFNNCVAITITSDPANNNIAVIGDILYAINTSDNTAIVNFGHNAIAGELTIPDAITHNSADYKVVKIDESAFNANAKITKVTVGANVESIQRVAFLDCTSLAELNFAPNSVLSSIGNRAFSNCKLTSLIFPISVKTMENESFRNNTSLNYVEMPGITSLKASAFLECGKSFTTHIPANATLSRSAIRMSDNVTFGPNPKYSVVRNMLIDNERNAVIIGSNDEYVEIPAGVKTIGSYAFDHCDAKHVYMPDVELVCRGAFGDCPLETVSMPKVKIIEKWAFVCNNIGVFNLKSAYMPNVEDVGISSFWLCEKLEQLSMPKVKTIRTSAFNACKQLTDVSIPNVEVLESNAFKDTALKSVDAPAARLLEGSVFPATVKVANLPNATNFKGDNVFAGKVNNVYLPATASTIHKTFYSNEVGTLTVTGLKNDFKVGNADLSADVKADDRLRFDTLIIDSVTGPGPFDFNNFKSKLICINVGGLNVSNFTLTPYIKGALYTWDGSAWTTSQTVVSVPAAITGLVYDGTVKTGVAAGTGYTLSGETATAAGKYTATAKLDNTAINAWSDGTTGDKSIDWSIGCASLTGAIVTIPNSTVYTGSEVKAGGAWYANSGKSISSTDCSFVYRDNINSGTASLTMVPIGTNTVGMFYAEYKILKATVDMSDVKWEGSSFQYDGTKKTVVITGVPKFIIISSYSGNEAVNAGKYHASVDLMYDSRNLNVWVPSHEWEILPIQNPVPSAGLFSLSYIYGSAPTYGGTVLSDPTYDKNNITLTYYADSECTVALSEAPTLPGTYWVKATITGLMNYSGVTSNAVMFNIYPVEEPDGFKIDFRIIFLVLIAIAAVIAYYAYRRYTREDD